jgi:hypothetical protein
VILEATVGAEDAAGRAVAGAEVRLETTVPPGEKVEQRLKLSLAAPQEGMRLVLRGTAIGSEEAFPAETSGEGQKRFPLVRTSVGLSRNLRNNAVYDRRWDWVLVGPGDGATRIQPKAADEQRVTFAWESRGAAIELVFRPRFYQKHRGLAYFEPWTYQAWKGSVTGYCTWWAYRDGFSQKTLDAIVDVFAEKHLPDFGYRYVQIDDSYQIGNGSCPQNWLTWNGKFPGGAEYAVRKIKSAGMKPGIWVHRVHRPSDPHVADIGKQHPDWFVHKPNGDLFMDAGFYILNTKNGAADLPRTQEAGLGIREDRRRGRSALLLQERAVRRTLQEDRLDAGRIAARLGPGGSRGTRQGHLHPQLLGCRSRPQCGRAGRRLPTCRRWLPTGDLGAIQFL